jgi:2-succinyl-5-enolpyruvyl-6-hydroxy-3-cyclohexene-1-carboxylate synthase
VLCLGEWPTSKQLRRWLQGGGVETWLVADDAKNHDALHGPTRHVRCTVEALAEAFPAGRAETAAYTRDWLHADRAARQAFALRFSVLDTPFEGKASWLLSQQLPPETPLMIASSMSVRDIEFFWEMNDRHCRPFFNRGANGIDGTLSTALGVAHGNRPAVLLTGDLALLHDTNGFLLRPKLRGSLTVVLINNRGGGIFEMLPVAKFDPPFEEFFATPQEVDFAKLCSAYGAEHVLVRDWTHLAGLVSALPATGLRVLELRAERKRDAAFRSELFAAAAQAAEASLVPGI